MNEIDSEIEYYRSAQSKYTYYLIALCVAGIGFSITQTMGRYLEYTMWPLGVSLFFFGFSIFSGLRFMKYVISGIFSNIEIKKIIHDQSEALEKTGIEMGIPYGHSLKTNAVKGIQQAVTKNSNAASWWSACQGVCFYLGVGAFVGWRIWEMYLLSPG